jgi:membrane protease YdiL (CAAX protease family)
MDSSTNNKRSILIQIGGILIALFFYQVVVHFVFYYQKDTLTTMFCHDLFMWLEVLVLYLYSSKVEISSFLLWQEKNYKVLFYVLSVVVLFLSQIPRNFIALIPGWLGLHGTWNIHYSEHAFNLIISWYHLNLAILVFSTLTWSICCELIFRGYLLPRLSNLLKNKVAAIIISSLLFAAFPYGNRTLRLLISDFFSGIFFAVHYQKYRNIKILIVSRVLIDTITMLLFRESILFRQPLHSHYWLYFLIGI